MPDEFETQVWPIDAADPDPEILLRAGNLLRSGYTVAFPTETVYGLGANALDESAVQRIYAAKGRPSRNPLIVHVDHIDAARRLAADWPPEADLLAGSFWPGPITLVLKRSLSIPESVPDIVTGGGETVGIRIPSHPVAIGLIRAAGLPIAAPSANRSEQLSPTRAEHVLRTLSGRISAILDAGPTSGGLESTVIGLTEDQPTLLRPGMIPPDEIEALIGPLRRNAADDTQLESSPLRAPGLMSRHYAPRARLLLSDNEHDTALELAAAGAVVGILTQNPAAYNLITMLITMHGVLMPIAPSAYSSRLFAALHELDALGVTHIVVGTPPTGEAWLAIHDRLRRAAAHTA